MAQRCLSAGYDSVMIDGSHLPFKDNVALTKAAAELAHRSGAWIEANWVPYPEMATALSKSARERSPIQAHASSSS